MYGALCDYFTWRVFYSCFLRALGGASIRTRFEGAPLFLCRVDCVFSMVGAEMKRCKDE